MDFTLVGTAVRVEGLATSQEPVVATVPALDSSSCWKPTRADGDRDRRLYEMADQFLERPAHAWQGNIRIETALAALENVRRQAHAQCAHMHAGRAMACWRT